MSVFDEDNVVSEETSLALARSAAVFGLERGVPGWANAWEAESFFENLNSAALGSNMWPVFDVQGRLFFRDYTVAGVDGQELMLRVAGNRVLGTPIISVERRLERTPLSRWIADARKLLEGKLGTDAIVCHAYPRLGLLRANEGERWLVDFAGGPPLDVSVGSLGEKMAWSPYDRIKEQEVADNIAKWNATAEKVREMSWSTLDELRSLARATPPEEIIPDVPLEGQGCTDCCVPAVAAMILGFHGIPMTDECHMFERMRTDSDPNNPGTSPQDEEKGYLASANGLSVSRQAPDLQSAIGEVGVKADGRPFKTGGEYTGIKHARAVVGYVDVVDSRGPQLIMHDPLKDGGTVVSETWDPMYHTSFLFIRPLMKPLASRSRLCDGT